MEETPVSAAKKAISIVLGVFIAGMAAVFYFIATGQRIWAIFWWATSFAGVIIAARLSYVAVRATVTGEGLSFERGVVLPAALFVITWVVAYVAAGWIGGYSTTASAPA